MSAYRGRNHFRNGRGSRGSVGRDVNSLLHISLSRSRHRVTNIPLYMSTHSLIPPPHYYIQRVTNLPLHTRLHVPANTSAAAAAAGSLLSPTTPYLLGQLTPPIARSAPNAALRTYPLPALMQMPILTGSVNQLNFWSNNCIHQLFELKGFQMAHLCSGAELVMVVRDCFSPGPHMHVLRPHYISGEFPTRDQVGKMIRVIGRVLNKEWMIGIKVSVVEDAEATNYRRFFENGQHQHPRSQTQ